MLNVLKSCDRCALRSMDWSCFCGVGGAWSGPERHADQSVPVAEFFEIVFSGGISLWAFRRLDRFVFNQATVDDGGFVGSQDLFQVKTISYQHASGKSAQSLPKQIGFIVYKPIIKPY